VSFTRPRPLIVGWRASELDRRLAAGEDPRISELLALRARRLIRARHRRNLADGLAGALRSARKRSHGFTAAAAPWRDEVLDAAAVIASIERRLRGAEPVAARGVALLRLLMIDGNGPLYRPADSGALGSRLRAAAAALNASAAVD
jgi:hypothetical protein